MPQTQVRDETAVALGQAIAQSWGAGASLDFDGSAQEEDGTPAAAIRVAGAETVWLAGDLPPGLPEAVATALGGEVTSETPPLDPSATCVMYRWGWAEQHGRADLWAVPETWGAFGDGEPADEAAPGAGDAETPQAAQPQPAPRVPEEKDGLAFLPSLSDGRAEDAGASIEMLLDVPLGVTVELGRAQKLIRDVLGFRAGSLIELDRPAGEPVDVLVNGRTIARGEVVVIDENFGVRITDVLSQTERLRRLA